MMPPRRCRCGGVLLPAALEIERSKSFGFWKTENRAVTFECDQCVETGKLPDGFLTTAHVLLALLILGWICFAANATAEDYSEQQRRITAIGILPPVLLFLLALSAGVTLAYSAFTSIRWRLRHPELMGASWLYRQNCKPPAPDILNERVCRKRLKTLRKTVFTALFWAMIALLLASTQARSGYQVQQLQDHGVKVQGHLTGVTRRSILFLIPMSYSMSAGFEDATGRKRSIEDSVSASTFSAYVHAGKWVPDTPVDVIYLPEDPTIASLAPPTSGWRLWHAFLPLLALGICVTQIRKAVALQSGS